jgi:hypothetical protein
MLILATLELLQGMMFAVCKSGNTYFCTGLVLNMATTGDMLGLQTTSLYMCFLLAGFQKGGEEGECGQLNLEFVVITP